MIQYKHNVPCNDKVIKVSAFSVIVTLTELRLGLIEILIDGIGSSFVKPSQSLITDVCSHSNTDICMQAVVEEVLRYFRKSTNTAM